MGFRPKVNIIDLDWPEEHRLHGLEIKIESVNVDEYSELMTLMFVPGEDRVQSIAQNDQVINRFAEALVSWNYEHPKTGEQLPADRAGVGRADPSHLTEMIAAWTMGMVTPPAPLPNGSKPGNPPSDSLESTLGLANQSQSRPN